MPEIPIVLVDREFWTSVIHFEELLKRGMIEGSELNLFTFAETAEEIWRAASATGLKVHLKWRNAGQPQL